MLEMKKTHWSIYTFQSLICWNFQISISNSNFIFSCHVTKINSHIDATWLNIIGAKVHDDLVKVYGSIVRHDSVLSQLYAEETGRVLFYGQKEQNLRHYNTT